jgi:hypothetical protein
MRFFIIRWVWLISSVGVALWLTQNMSLRAWFAVFALISLGWVGYTVYIKREFKWSLLSYISTPIIVWASALSLLIFMREGKQHWILIALTFVLSWIWSATLQKRDDFEGKAVFRGNLLSYINSFIVFFSASSLFGADIFVSFSKWQSVTIILLLSFVLHFQTMRASHISIKDSLLFSLVASLLIAEIFGSLLFWPSAFLVNGVIVTVAFYILTGMSRCILTSILSKKLIGKYLAWGSLIIFAILITADWQ